MDFYYLFYHGNYETSKSAPPAAARAAGQPTGTHHAELHAFLQF